LNVTLQN
ncbi:putative clp amino terminal domain protein, partial [Vibrio parahaemolyticus V-223/04]